MIAPLLLAAAPPATLTLQEALNLPATTLIARVLGPTESRFKEVRRPYLGGLPGRVGFNLDFAAVPHPTAYPGLCEADIVSVYFWPQEGNPDPNQVMTEHPRLHFTMFRLMEDLLRLAAAGGQGQPSSEATCAAAGPVLSSDDRIGRRTHFFYTGHGGENVLNALQTYLAARSLGAIIARARGGQLPAVDCSAEGNVCDDPRRLLASLAVDRLNGFDLVPCVDDGPPACVETTFSPDPDPNSNLMLTILIEAASGRFDSPTADVSARHIRIEESRPID